ncbi:medium-chain acyl-CoA ligase ACSF2, mitochondrial [Ambystoma mexicanum]|uniref:medium-chain acyl-CoA ligase ACSF2, mitochondrial n=1 Tax=Ambystoma mexicanum TaxID=8296 RepID=UPI0037E8027D
MSCPVLRVLCGGPRGWCHVGIRTYHRTSVQKAADIPSRPVTSNSYVHGISNVRLSSRTVAQCLQDTANRLPDREAVVFPQNEIRKTFAQLTQEVCDLASGLLALGFKPGDRLGMWGPNSYEWVLMQFATAQAGIILVSVNPAYQAMELEYVLKQVGCKGLIFQPQFKSQNYYEILQSICPELASSSAGALKSPRLPDLTTVIMTDCKMAGTFQFSEVIQAGSTRYVEQLRDAERKLSCDDPINVQFTSGTTGYPKGATLSHHNIVNNANLIGHRMGFDWKEDVRCALSPPLFHCLGSVGGTMVMATHGVTMVFPSPGFDAKATLKTIEEEKCTFLYGTPTMYIDIMGQPDFSNYNVSTVMGGVVAGSTCPQEVMNKMITKLNMREVVVAYGTTETSPVTFMGFPNDDNLKKTKTTGFIFPHTEAKVVCTQTGQILPLNSPGELLVRGYCVMLGYWNNPEKTKECFSPGNWYKTGDIATLDKLGYCTIVGRCKDMIIRGGENIYPAEIEQLLHTHPNIQEAQVVGIDDERMGEEVCACLKLKDGQECTVEEVKAFCKGKIAHFKIPRHVLFVAGFPLTVSGKIQKFKLKEIAEKQFKC